LCVSCHRIEHIRINEMLDGPKMKPERKLRKNAGLSVEERKRKTLQLNKEWAIRNKDRRNAQRNERRKRARLAGIPRKPPRPPMKNLFD